MKAMFQICLLSLVTYTSQSTALSLAPEEFTASRQLACVLAQQSLGQLSESEYGAKANTLLDGFDEAERNNILAQAVGYFGGLMFTPANDNADKLTLRLENFVSSSTCSEGYSKVTLSL